MYGKYVEMYVPQPGVIFMLTKYKHEGVPVFPLSTEYESDIIPTSDFRTAVKFVNLTHHESVTRRRYDNRQTDERTGGGVMTRLLTKRPDRLHQCVNVAA